LWLVWLLPGDGGGGSSNARAMRKHFFCQIRLFLTNPCPASVSLAEYLPGRTGPAQAPGIGASTKNATLANGVRKSIQGPFRVRLGLVNV
jgi:hypothetical protein